MPFPILEDKIKVLPHSCFICSKAFVRKSTLLKHYLEHSKELGPNLENLEEARALFLQRKITSSNETINKDQSQSNSNDKEFYQSSSQDVKTLPYKCIVCSKSFVREKSLYKHYQEHPKELGPNLEKLEEFTAKYLVQKSDNQYYNFVEGSNLETTNSEQNCNQNVIQNLDSNDIIITNLESNVMVQDLHPSDIVQHIDPNNVGTLNPESDFAIGILSNVEAHECPECKVTFSSISSLKRHAFNHMKGQTFTCMFCQECFASKNELQSHYSIHQTVQYFECHDCHQTFTSNSAFENHKFQDGHFGSSKFFCDKCKIGFVLEKEYKTHCSIHEKKEVCDICNKTFSRHFHLKKHFLLHAGKEPYSCNFCETSFFQKMALNMHFLKMHPHEIKFVCYVCVECFAEEEDLMKHNSIHYQNSKNDTALAASEETFDKKKESKSQDLTSMPEKNRLSDSSSLDVSTNKTETLKSKNKQKTTKIYFCNLCDIAFGSKVELEKHKLNHNEEGDLKSSTGKKRKSKHESEAKKKKIQNVTTLLCDICEETIDSNDLEDHMLMHNKGRMYNCRICSKGFMFKEDLEAHSKAVHENGKPFSCSVCNEGFAFKSDLRQHNQTHTLKKKTDKSELAEHSRSSRTKNSKHSCSACEEKFNSRAALEYHELVHQEPESEEDQSSDEDLISKKIKRSVCRYCQKSFKSKPELTKHLSHCENRSSHQCKNCNSCFKSKPELLEHKKVHSRRQPFICKVCNEGFQVKDFLEEHQQVHDTDPTYPCNICDKIFTQKENLKEHKLCHQDEIVYICRVCDSTFENKTEFKAHRSTHDIITHQCKVCNETFGTRKELKRHYLKHILERPNLCRICSASFEQWGALRRHYLSHTRN